MLRVVLQVAVGNSNALPAQSDGNAVRRDRIDEALQDAQEAGARLQHLALLNLYGPPQV